MPEGANVEIAHSLTEHHHHEARSETWHLVLEIFEVFLLAVVAVSTAWSGFQAAKWDGRQSFDYGTSSRLPNHRGMSRCTRVPGAAPEVTWIWR